MNSTENITKLVDKALVGIQAKDVEPVARAIGKLSEYDSSEILAYLFEIIVDSADAWGPNPFPETDGWGEKGVDKVIEAVRKADMEELKLVLGNDIGSVLTKLLGVAAVLKKST